MLTGVVCSIKVSIKEIRINLELIQLYSKFRDIKLCIRPRVMHQFCQSLCQNSQLFFFITLLPSLLLYFLYGSSLMVYPLIWQFFLIYNGQNFLHSIDVIYTFYSEHFCYAKYKISSHKKKRIYIFQIDSNKELARQVNFCNIPQL